MTGSVAVIGAGPGGVVTARWLLSQGFEPTIFEKAPMLGGQWTGLDGISGVWPTMHTNTSRILTSFSDLENGTSRVFPSARDIAAYLYRYAQTFGLISRIRFDTTVDRLSRGSGSWLVEHSGMTEAFERVVVATGRFQSPSVPAVSGLETFTGPAGAGRPGAHPGKQSPALLHGGPRSFALESRTARSAHDLPLISAFYEAAREIIVENTARA